MTENDELLAEEQAEYEAMSDIEKAYHDGQEDGFEDGKLHNAIKMIRAEMDFGVISELSSVSIETLQEQIPNQVKYTLIKNEDPNLWKMKKDSL